MPLPQQDRCTRWVRARTLKSCPMPGPTPGRAQRSPPAPKAHGGASAQDMGCIRQMLLRAPKTLCSGEGTQTARQPTRKDLRTDLTKGYTKLKYRNRERKWRAIQRQPRGGRTPRPSAEWWDPGGWPWAGRRLGRRVRSGEARSCLLRGQRRGFGFYSQSGGKPSVTEATSGSRYKKRRGCGSQVEAGSRRWPRWPVSSRHIRLLC